LLVTTILPITGRITSARITSLCVRRHAAERKSRMSYCLRGRKPHSPSAALQRSHPIRRLPR